MTGNFVLEWRGRDGVRGRKVVNGEDQLQAASKELKAAGLRFRGLDAGSEGPGPGEWVSWEM